MENKLDFLMELIHCSHPLYHWVYSGQGELLESNVGENERIMDILFNAEGIKSYMLHYAKTNTAPLILSSSLGNLWVAAFEPPADSHAGASAAGQNLPGKKCHVLGPLFTEVISRDTLLKRSSKYDIALNWKETFIALIQQFNVVPWTTLITYTIMLHYTLTGEHIQSSDFAYQSTMDNDPFSPSQGTEQEQKKNLPWMVEQALFDNIRIGNLNYRAALSDASGISSGIGIETGDSLRRALYSGIVFAALGARAAIDGGLPPQLAYTIQNRYTKNLESAKSMSEIANVNHQMYEEFIRRVHDLEQCPGLSPQIKSCRDYIELHADQKITLHELAKHIGYTDYYLSRRFQKETGVSINTYIKQAKVKQAKILLASTTMSIQAISDTFAFCSRSHFSDTFHKIAGLTPVEYRNKHKK